MEEIIKVKMNCDKYFVLSKLLDVKFKFVGLRDLSYLCYEKNNAKIFLRVFDDDSYQVLKQSGNYLKAIRDEHYHSYEYFDMELRRSGYRLTSKNNSRVQCYENGSKRFELEENKQGELYMTYSKQKNSVGIKDEFKSLMNLLSLNNVVNKNTKELI